MAQPDNVRRTTTTDAANAPRPQNSPGSKSGDSSSWSSNSSLKLRKSHDNEEPGSANHQKKSMFSKVKEKARKLKKSLSGRKRRDDNELRSPSLSTPPGSAGPVKDEKQRPQFFSSPTPLSGSSVSEDTKTNSSKEQPQETKKETSETSAPSKNEPPPPPTANDPPETTATPDAKDIKTSSETKEKDESSNETQDKGVSVTEYLMNKLEPGEDERALSQVITHTLSPKCEKMKEAVNSLLRSEESMVSNDNDSNSEADTTNVVDSDSNQDTGARSSVESVDPAKLNSLIAFDHDPSDGPESRLSNVSATSASTSCQNQNVKELSEEKKG